MCIVVWIIRLLVCILCTYRSGDSMCSSVLLYLNSSMDSMYSSVDYMYIIVAGYVYSSVDYMYSSELCV